MVTTDAEETLDRSALVERHYAAVFSLARKLTRNEETAREVTQETFLRALTRLHQYDGVHKLSSWLFKIATNLVRDQHRRKGRWEGGVGEPAVESPPEAILQKSEDLRSVRRALDTLSDDVRTAMILHLQEGLTLQEISFVLELTVHSVRMKIYRGLRKVRARVREER